MKTGLISCSTLALMLGLAMPAMAQDVATPQDAAEGAGGDTIIVTGTRTTGLRAVDSPTPIQVLGADSLKRVGQTDIMQVLAQQLPSIQAQAFGSDQAAFHPAIKLRGLSPNHTLVLVNGKRRHSSSNVNVSGGPFGGNASADLGLIPTDAIGRVEILQDGAAAVYGTDAIAGVVNFILKDSDSAGSLNVQGGHYMDQGGETYDIMGNFGIKPWEDAFLNITVESKFKDYSFRGDLDPRVVDTGVTGSANIGPGILANYPQVAQQGVYPYVNQIVGDGRMYLYNTSYNFGWDVSDSMQLYSFGTASYRKGKTWQNYRLPTVVFGKMPKTGTAPATNAATSADVPFQAGFRPQEMTIEKDWAVTAGLKGDLGENTTFDVSSSLSRDINEIYVIGSANAALYYDTSTTTTRGSSPAKTHNGDFIAKQWLNTLELKHEIDAGLSEPITLAGGLEYREDSYELRDGDVASYYVSTNPRAPGGGIQSFFGYSPNDASYNKRKVFAQYADVALRPVEQWYVEGAVRHEHYSDFGDTTIWKVASRFDVAPGVFAIRGNASTGFRAPALAEGFYSGINVSVASLSGIFAPNSTGAAALGIANLRPEKSRNYSAGFVLTPAPGVSVTLDAYSINIKDRIVQSGGFIGYTSTPNSIVSPSVLDALRANGVPVDAVISTIQSGQSGSVSVNTFVNGVTTLTRGVEFMATYRADLDSLGTLDLSYGANYNTTKIKKVNAPPTNVNPLTTLLDTAALSQLTKTTPKFRATLGAFWEVGKFSLNLRESYYGNSYQLQALPSNGRDFRRVGTGYAFITDLEASFKPVDQIKISIGANNLFNKYPKEVPAYIRTEQYVRSSTAYITKYPSFSPFGINGGFYYARLNFTW